MEQRTYTVYKFNELPEKSKELALEKHRDINVDHDGWSDPILESLTTQANDAGFLINQDDISYHGFNCQGDGLCFDCKTFDLDKIVNFLGLNKDKKFRHYYGYAKKFNLLDRLILSLNKNNYANHYSHSRTRYFDIEIDTDKESKVLNYLRQVILEQCNLPESYRNMCNTAYNNLANYYEELQEDQAVIETINCNEYDFKLDGSID